MLGASIWKQKLELVDNRANIQEIGANVGNRICCSNYFKFTVKMERDRDQNVVHSSRDRKMSRKSLNGKLTRPSEEREWLSRNRFEAGAEVEASNWEKRNSDIAFRESNQKFESQRFQLRQASRWAAQSQRDRISLYGEFELKNRLSQADHAR